MRCRLSEPSLLGTGAADAAVMCDVNLSLFPVLGLLIWGRIDLPTTGRSAGRAHGRAVVGPTTRRGAFICRACMWLWCSVPSAAQFNSYASLDACTRFASI